MKDATGSTESGPAALRNFLVMVGAASGGTLGATLGGLSGEQAIALIGPLLGMFGGAYLGLYAAAALSQAIAALLEAPRPTAQVDTPASQESESVAESG